MEPGGVGRWSVRTPPGSCVALQGLKVHQSPAPYLRAFSVVDAGFVHM